MGKKPSRLATQNVEVKGENLRSQINGKFIDVIVLMKLNKKCITLEPLFKSKIKIHLFIDRRL
jgi:hypothetical protein